MDSFIWIIILALFYIIYILAYVRATNKVIANLRKQVEYWRELAYTYEEILGKTESLLDSIDVYMEKKNE